MAGHGLAKRQEWRHRLARFRPGEMTIGAFCAAEGVSTASFYQWRRRLTDERGGPSQEGGFRPIQVIEAAASGGVTVRLPGDVAIELGTNLTIIDHVVRQLVASQAGGDLC